MRGDPKERFSEERSARLNLFKRRYPKDEIPASGKVRKMLNINLFMNRDHPQRLNLFMGFLIGKTWRPVGMRWDHVEN